jgi:ERCC4-type nuclease
MAICCRVGRGEAYVLDYLLERKAAGDLASSIKDGRYGRQKAAMRATGLRRLLYVLEGEPGTLPSASIAHAQTSLQSEVASSRSRLPEHVQPSVGRQYRQLDARQWSSPRA